jgi:Zn-dependent M28 family amino/carboxypeptidase
MRILCAAALLAVGSVAQSPSRSQFGARDRVAALIEGSTGVWTTEQIATITRMRDAALDDSYALDRLRYLTDNIGPRQAGSAQAEAAVEYVMKEMSALGASVQREKVTVPHWVRGVETGELVSWPGYTPGTVQKIVLTALGDSVATPADGLTADVVVANSFADLKPLLPAGAKGKIVLFNVPFDDRLADEGNALAAYEHAVMYRGSGPVAAALVGASAVLVRSVGNTHARLPHTGGTRYAPDVPKIPAAAVTSEDADLIAALAREGTVRMRLVLTPQSLPPVESANAIADWKGSEHPEEIVIVSGHLDSWDLGTGAIDDGAGVVMAMQTIHLLQKLGIRPRRTVRMVAWMNEEMGADGAKAYAADHAGDIENHVAAMEADLGAGRPVGIDYHGTPEIEQWLRPVTQLLEPLGGGVMNRGDTGTDVAPLAMKGVPTFSPIQDTRRYFLWHHSAADTFDKIDARELNENAAVMAALAYAMADAPERVPK